MTNSILENHGANFFGFEHLDSAGKRHYHPTMIKGGGDLVLTPNEVYFRQWIPKKEIHIPIDKITKVEIKAWHNLKMKWPAKVLRIYFQEGNETKIFGIAPGGKLSLTNGWQDEAYVWQKEIESLLKQVKQNGQQS